jgi:hypothetical protein
LIFKSCYSFVKFIPVTFCIIVHRISSEFHLQIAYTNNIETLLSALEGYVCTHGISSC